MIQPAGFESFRSEPITRCHPFFHLVERDDRIRVVFDADRIVRRPLVIETTWDDLVVDRERTASEILVYEK